MTQAESLRAALHRDPQVCNDKSHARWKMLSRCDHIAARVLAALAATPPTEGLHETHVCRDCGAEITLPYAKSDEGLEGYWERAYWDLVPKLTLDAPWSDANGDEVERGMPGDSPK